MNTLAPSFLIGSSSFLQVTMTCMKAWMSLNFGKFATELRPLIYLRNKFLLNISKTNKPIKTKFVYTLSLTRSALLFVNHCFLQTCNRVTALD